MSFAIIRWILGAFCILFAPAFGKSVVKFREGREKQSKLLAWALRFLVTGAAVAFKAGFDRTTWIIYALALAGFGAGVYLESRPHREEKLEEVMFPRE